MPEPQTWTVEEVKARADMHRAACDMPYGSGYSLTADMLDAFAASLEQTCETCQHTLARVLTLHTTWRMCRYLCAAVPLTDAAGMPFGCRGWTAKETSK
jgi:hypothetical protein